MRMMIPVRAGMGGDLWLQDGYGWSNMEEGRGPSIIPLMPKSNEMSLRHKHHTSMCCLPCDVSCTCSPCLEPTFMFICGKNGGNSHLLLDIEVDVDEKQK
jgi:hypothetical protein